jgi:hypothetical protein
LLLVALAVSVAAPVVAQAPDRWFAIAYVKGDRHHLGPFVTLEACEEERLNPGRARTRMEVLDDDLAQSPLPSRAMPEAQRREMEKKHDRLMASQVSERMQLVPRIEFWRDKAICQRF